MIFTFVVASSLHSTQQVTSFCEAHIIIYRNITSYLIENPFVIIITLQCLNKVNRNNCVVVFAHILQRKFPNHV